MLGLHAPSVQPRKRLSGDLTSLGYDRRGLLVNASLVRVLRGDAAIVDDQVVCRVEPLVGYERVTT